MPIVMSTRLRAMLALLLALLVSASASASVGAALECRMGNGKRCHCTHAASASHAAAHVALSRPGCCTVVELARAPASPTTTSVHVAPSAPVLVELPALALAPVERAPVVVTIARASQPRVSTGPPIPVRLRHLLI